MFQPNLNHDTLKALASDRLIAKLATRYEPEKRHAGNPGAQAEALAEMAADVADQLPAKASPEAIGTILDRAWRELRRAYGYQTWPKIPTVLHHVREAVQDWQAKAAASAPTTYRPQRPSLPHPTVCQQKAEHFRKLGADLLADYWTKLGADSAIAWTAWNGRAQ